MPVGLTPSTKTDEAGVVMTVRELTTSSCMRAQLLFTRGVDIPSGYFVYIFFIILPTVRYATYWPCLLSVVSGAVQVPAEVFECTLFPESSEFS